MKYFGSISSNEDLVTKEYVDNSISEYSRYTVNYSSSKQEPIPLAGRNMVILVPEYTDDPNTPVGTFYISELNGLKVGTEMNIFIYSDNKTPGTTTTIKVAINKTIATNLGEFPVIYDFYYQSTNSSNSLSPYYSDVPGISTKYSTMPGSFDQPAINEIEEMTSLALHLFFDGVFIYINRYHSYQDYIVNSSSGGGSGHE